jgi:hypothetical protein
MTENRKNFILLCGCFLLAVLFDFLFYEKVIGISYPIFWLVFYGLFFLIFREKLTIAKRFEWFLMIPILLLIFTFLLFSSQEFLALNSIIVPMLFIVQTVLLTKNNKNPWYKGSFIGELGIKVIKSTINVVVPFKLMGRWLKISSFYKSTYGVIGKVLIGIFISLPLVGIILGLLTSADSIFNYWVNEIPNWFGKIDLGDLPYHLFLILFVFFVLFTYLWSLLRPYQKEEDPLEKIEWNSVRIDGIISLNILFVIDLVYVLFTVIQVSYLFGQAKLLLPDGITYAEYATDGFYQLVMVTIINIFIVITFIHLVHKAQPMIHRIVQILLSLLTICTGFMLLSAFLRLSLYEEVYGFTYIRILVHSFMILLLVLFIVALIKTWRNDISLMKNYTVIFLIWYVGLNYVNIDHIIAEQNAARYYKTKGIAMVHQPTLSYDDRNMETKYVDIYYLAQLSYDVVPQLLKLREEKNLKPIIDSQLINMKYQLEEENDWQSFNFSKHKARQLLQEMK